MADCGVGRCLQERRCFRKELQKWRQNILLMIGYECIAENIIGRDKWTTIMEPFTNSNDDAKACDWTPKESCWLCKNRKHGAFDLPAENKCDENSKDYDEKIALKYLEELMPSWNSITSSNVSIPHDPDQPLDLSMSNKERAMIRIKDALREKEVHKAASTGLKVPEVKKKHNGFETKPLKKVRPGEGPMRRNYTDEELHAAIDDIRSGKLGTRRAAVLYGIPRSTLRNKVYKLEAEKLNGTQKKSSRSSSPAHCHSAVQSTPCQSASQSLRDLIHRKITDSLQGTATDSVDKSSSSPPTLTNQDLLNKKPEELKQKLKTSVAYSVNGSVPFLPEVIQKLALERLTDERRNVARLSGDSNLDDADFQLKIPSYKPTRPLTTTDILSTESKAFGNAIKAIISKTLSERLNGRVGSDEDGKLASACGFSRKRKSHQSHYLSKPTGKGTRPKRGRYRNYDHDNLAMAVQSVQRGEMSVHRAGTFYGVPHSTLEYKVKERHLLRKKKMAQIKDQQRMERLQRLGLAGLTGDDSGENSSASSFGSDFIKESSGGESSNNVPAFSSGVQPGTLYMSELLRQLKGRYDQAMAAAGSVPWSRDSVISYVQSGSAPSST